MTHSIKTVIFSLVLMINAVLISATAFAGDKVYTGLFSDTALGGYDAVSYFTDGKPVKGSKRHKLEYLDAVWYFSSAANKALFNETPERYAPQYGGFCAWAVGANSARAAGDPKVWKIVDKKLYLNYNKSVQEKWLVDVPGFIKKADENWPKLLAE